MPSIHLSDLVFAAVSEQRHNGETEDDLLRRLLGLPSRSNPDVARRGALREAPSPPRISQGPRRLIANRRMSSYVAGNQLIVGFTGGPDRRWPLPPASDKGKIRDVRDQAVKFAKENGATVGQQNAVKKALTDAGFHLYR